MSRLENAIAQLRLDNWDAAVIEASGQRYLLVAPPKDWQYKPGREIQKRFADLIRQGCSGDKKPDYGDQLCKCCEAYRMDRVCDGCREHCKA